MDLKEKIRRLKELKQRNKELNTKINHQTANYIKGKKATVDDNYIKKLSSRTINSKTDKTKGISLRDYFKEQNTELYEEIENEKQRKEYIESILSMSHNNSIQNTNNTNLQQALEVDNLKDISGLREFTNTLLESRTRTHNTPELYNNMSIVSSDESTSEISSLTSSVLSSEFEDLTTDDELYLTDSDMGDDSEIEQVYETISTTDANTEAIKSRSRSNSLSISANNNTTKSIKIDHTKKISRQHEDDLENRERMQQEIDFLRTASESVKNSCFDYLKTSYSKLLKIIKIYLVMCRNDFIQVSNEITNEHLFGYKFVNYDCKKCLIKGTLLKIMFVFNGKVELKDFVVHKYNKQSRRLEAYYCNITEDEYTGEILINKAKKITKIHPNWITFTRVKPSELIEMFSK
jgi:hypothetical protein